MKKRREISLFSISFLDLLSGALGAVIILYVAIPKSNPKPSEVSENEVKIASYLDEIKNLQEQLEKAKSKPVISQSITDEEEKKEKDALDYGFQFKGTRIVFLIDTSYSMFEEDRMGQVKAGLKMLITSLSPKYNIEIVQFPFGERAPFKSMWGNLQALNSTNKMDAFDFVYTLKPWGGTPTRDALTFVLQNYDKVSDIVLLSDGIPTIHNKNKKDDIYDILKVVRELNKNKIQINTIGVGKDFIRDKTNDRYKFLSLLSEESGGFFVGF